MPMSVARDSADGAGEISGHLAGSVEAEIQVARGEELSSFEHLNEGCGLVRGKRFRATRRVSGSALHDG